MKSDARSEVSSLPDAHAAEDITFLIAEPDKYRVVYHAKAPGHYGRQVFVKTGSNPKRLHEPITALAYNAHRHGRGTPLPPYPAEPLPH
eukprot:TRINITY_DN14453_c0_g2_i2.p1 TRINITY_DN14453_c0_g2~~TRINITY_DN14453_c0_g2_i2.p1  ORF type:complete len:102 (-),score=10.47 TRINITY_DN14453_c0_g2_i2:455-721(-)